MKGQTEEEDKKSPCASLKTIKDIKPFQNKQNMKLKIQHKIIRQTNKSQTYKIKSHALIPLEWINIVYMFI